MSGIRQIGISRDILILFTLGAVAVLAPNAVQAICVLFGHSGKKYSRKAVARSFERLRSAKLISYYLKKDGTFVFELTKDGRRKTRVFQADAIIPARQKHWDGIWRVIFSDIAEKHKQGRDALRSKLYQWGARPLQKSVFVYPYPCQEEIVILRDLFEIPHNALFIVETRSVPNEKELRKFFQCL